MTPKKPTPKKKSAPSSPRSKTPEGLTIFEVNGGKIVGRIARRSAEGYVLEWAAQLSFAPVPLEGGRRFKVEAHLLPFTPCLPLFTLMGAGIRGYAVETRPWLADLYGRFVERAERGEFDLNPYAPSEKVELQVGDGAVEAEVEQVSIVQAVGVTDAPPAEAPNA